MAKTKMIAGATYTREVRGHPEWMTLQAARVEPDGRMVGWVTYPGCKPGTKVLEESEDFQSWRLFAIPDLVDLSEE